MPAIGPGGEDQNGVAQPDVYIIGRMSPAHERSQPHTTMYTRETEGRCSRRRDPGEWKHMAPRVWRWYAVPRRATEVHQHVHHHDHASPAEVGGAWCVCLPASPEVE
jgi:hypothetical protein